MVSIPQIPELHKLTDFTAVLPDGSKVKGEYPDKRFPDVRPQRWKVQIYLRGGNCWPMVEARLEDVQSPADLWERIVKLRDALKGTPGLESPGQ